MNNLMHKIASVLAITVIAAIPGYAYDFMVDDLCYNILPSQDKTVEVTTTAEDWWDSSSYAGDIEIPGEVKYENITYKVESIGYGAFSSCQSLTSVTIPNSVITIGDYAFTRCSSLKSVTFGNSITTIGSSAFSGCMSLTEIAIPNTVTSIDDRAFEHCDRLTSITIPGSVASIGERVFGYCSSLEEINVDESNPNYSSADGALFNKDKTTLITVGRGKNGDFIIPNSVTTIGDSALEYCSGLTSVTIPNSVTKIGDDAFESCSGITAVTIPNSITSIGVNAFRGCSALTSVSIPASVTSIGNNAFGRCTVLAEINVDAGNSNYCSVDGVLFSKDKATLIVAGGAKKGDFIIPNTVTSIESYAFSGCSGLTSVTIPNSVTSIGENAFYYCEGLTSVTIPNSVTSIGGMTFYCCSGLTSVTISNSITSIARDAFYGCEGLTSVTIPNSVTSIEYRAFGYCSGLTSVTIPNSVTSIDSNAFSDCSGLTSVTIPNSVTKIGAFAFSGCDLKQVYCAALTPPSLGLRLFSDKTFADGVLHVPVGTKADYENAEGWKDFSKIEEYDFSDAGIEDIISEGNMSVTTDGGCINILNKKAGVIVRVYTVQGALVAETAGDEIRDITAGLYVVTVGNRSFKISVQ